MKLNKMQKRSLQIIVLFVIAMLSTLIPENFPALFGDWVCQGSGEKIDVGYAIHYTKCDYNGFHNPTTHFGFRHWIYIAMCVVLFVIQILDIFD